MVLISFASRVTLYQIFGALHFKLKRSYIFIYKCNLVVDNHFGDKPGVVTSRVKPSVLHKVSINDCDMIKQMSDIISLLAL